MIHDDMKYETLLNKRHVKVAVNLIDVLIVTLPFSLFTRKILSQFSVKIILSNSGIEIIFRESVNH